MDGRVSWGWQEEGEVERDDGNLLVDSTTTLTGNVDREVSYTIQRQCGAQ